MKKPIKTNAVLLLAVAGAAFALGGCKSTAKIPVNFVAVTSSEWNASVDFGTYAYKFKGNLGSGNSFTLKGTTQGRVKKSSGNQGRPFAFKGVVDDQPGGDMPGGDMPGGDQPGGMPGGDQPGGGGPGGGQQQEVPITGMNFSLKSEIFIDESVKAEVTYFPADTTQKTLNWSSGDEKIATVDKDGNVTGVAEGTTTITAVSAVDETINGTLTVTVKKENLAQYDFEVKGKYELDPGYGYVLHFEDEVKTVIHADFNRSEGRHEFYYNTTINEVTKLVKFQAKDPTFVKSLAADYKPWDERDSKYIFCAKATGNNNSVATAYLYLHHDGGIVDNAPSGAQREITLGKTWSEEGDVITIKDGQNEYKSVKSVNPDHPGYRISVGSKTYFYSANPDVRWKKMTASDFDGPTKYSFSGSYTTSGPDGATHQVQLNLGEDGKAHAYSDGATLLAEGTWNESNGEIALVLGGKQYASVVVDSVRQITIQVEVQSMKGTEMKDVTLVEGAA